MNFQRCDDGSDGRRGFVSTPANDTDWPVCKYGTYQYDPCLNLYSHKTLSCNHPFSSSYSLSCAASSPPWRSTTGQEPTFSRIRIFSSEGFIHCGARRAQEELFVGHRGEQVEVFLLPGWQLDISDGIKLDLTF